MKFIPSPLTKMLNKLQGTRAIEFTISYTYCSPKYFVVNESHVFTNEKFCFYVIVCSPFYISELKC